MAHDAMPPRIPLAHLPTPVEALPRLSAHLNGPSIFVKRDDLTGLAFGGNKTRKLEFLLAAATAAGSQRLITRGAAQSNHCRQTAAAAAKRGFSCTLVLSGTPPDDINGNLLLHSLLGADLVWAGSRDPDAVLEETFETLSRADEQPYLIPYGGSNPVGAQAYAFALKEWIEQDLPAERIVFATSSGGTQAGLVLGAKLFGYEGRITGISVDKPAHTLRPIVVSLANQTLEKLGYPGTIGDADVDIIDEYLGGGYGIMGNPEREAISLFATREGLMLDPVYTGRAAAGLLDSIRRGVFNTSERILFWHTGGTPGLFAYAQELCSG